MATHGIVLSSVPCHRCRPREFISISWAYRGQKPCSSQHVGREQNRQRWGETAQASAEHTGGVGTGATLEAQEALAAVLLHSPEFPDSVSM